MHTNRGKFAYGRVYKTAEGETKTTKYNHYSCFGSWPAVMQTPIGPKPPIGKRKKNKPTNKIWFSTNYSAANARLLINMMKRDLKQFIIGGVTYELPKVRFYTANSRASGYISDMDYDYFTVMLPKGIQVNHIYSLVKPIAKVLGSTLKHTDGNLLLKKFLEIGCDNFNEIQVLMGLNDGVGGYNYPIGPSYFIDGPKLAQWCRGIIDYGDQHSHRQVNRPEWVVALENFTEDVPMGPIPGAPKLVKGYNEVSDYLFKSLVTRTNPNTSSLFLAQLNLLRQIQQENQ